MALLGCAEGERSAPATGLELGQQIYDRSCASCHGDEGQGGVGPQLGGGAVAERIPDPADQERIVAEGRNTMPAFGRRLSSEEIAAVVRFTREKLGR